MRSDLKIMSIGTDCTLADIFKKLGIRESGPVDWAYTESSIFNVGNLLSGCMLDRLLDKQWDSNYNYYSGMEDINSNQYQFGLCNYRYIHEILTDKSDYKKLLYRFLKLEEFKKKIGDNKHYLAYSLNASDSHAYDMTNLIIMLDKLNVPRDSIIIVTDPIYSNNLFKDYFKYIQIPDFSKYWTDESLKSNIVKVMEIHLSNLLT